MKKRRILKSFSLIETLVAIFILEVGILGIASFYASSLRTARVARNETIAANLAAGLLDAELANTFDNLTPIDGIEVRYDDVLGQPFYDWYKKTEIYYIDASLAKSINPTNMKKVVVTISWTEGASEKTLESASIKAKH